MLTVRGGGQRGIGRDGVRDTWPDADPPGLVLDAGGPAGDDDGRVGRAFESRRHGYPSAESLGCFGFRQIQAAKMGVGREALRVRASDGRLLVTDLHTDPAGFGARVVGSGSDRVNCVLSGSPSLSLKAPPAGSDLSPPSDRWCG